MSNDILHTYDGTSWAQLMTRWCREGAEVRLHLTRATIIGVVTKAGYDYLNLTTSDGDQVLVRVAAIEAVTHE